MMKQAKNMALGIKSFCLYVPLAIFKSQVGKCKERICGIFIRGNKMYNIAMLQYMSTEVTGFVQN